MDFSALRFHGLKAVFAMLALTACAGTMHATNTLSVSASTLTLNCNTQTGPASGTITVKAVTAPLANAPITVTTAAVSNGVVVTAPSSSTLTSTNNTAGIVFTVSFAPGCVGAAAGNQTLTFKNGATNDVTVAVTTTLTATSSGLAASAVTITCARTSGGVYTPGAAQTVSATSTATPGGTPFTVDTVTNAPPAWLTVTPTTGGTATATPVTFTVVAASGCGAFASGTSTIGTIHLLNAPAPDKVIQITLQVVPPTPLTVAPSPATLSYTKLSGTAGYVDVRVTSAVNPAPFFAVNTATLPIWLTVDSTTGSVPKNLRFSTTSVCDTLAPGTYSANVALKVSGYADSTLPVSLLVTNKAPRLSVSEGTTRNISWTLGQPLPTPVITAVSSDSPIPYSVTTGGTLAPVVSSSQQQGLAYAFGTPISVSFNPLVFAAAVPGSILTGTVTLNWGSPVSTIVVTFNVSILSPGAALSGLTPASLPTAGAGASFNVVLTGSGFVPSADLTQKTKVGVVLNNSIVTDPAISANVINPSNIILTITVPASADPNLPFATSGAGGNVVLGICNPGGGTCSTPTGTAVLTIGGGPIIQAVTSAAAFVQVTPPTLPTIAPFDMVSIFGANFCSSGGTGCGSSQVLYGTEDATLRYTSTLSPDSAGATQRFVTVSFLTHGSSTVLGVAPLLFVTNSQINLLVPAALSGSVGAGTVDMVVSFGYGSGATLLKSSPFNVNVASNDPGIFTVGADGQGSGAILDSTYAIVSPGNPAGVRSTAADSDVIQLYVTGLGAPDATGSSSTGISAYPADCTSLGTYLSNLNAFMGSSLTNLDGTTIQSAALGAGRLPPCLATAPTVTIGGVAATSVLYAGFVPDTISGLYQINVKLPGSAAAYMLNGVSVSPVVSPVLLPVTVTVGGVPTQAGVSVWVAPRLKVVAPTALSGTVGVVWASSNNSVVATEGTGNYIYSLTSGLLPSGLSLNFGGAITGTPAANTGGTYIVTVTATDSANIPVTGSVTFTLTVAGGLYMTSTGTAPYHATFATAAPSLTTVTATGGVYPYAYAITSPSSIPTGMTVNASSGVVGTSAATPAGTYHVTITATDATVGTPLSGGITFDIAEALHVTATAPVAGAHGAASTISTVSATGNTGTVSYALDTASAALSWLSINSSTGVIAVTNAAPASTVINAVVTATDGTAPANAASAGTGTVPVTITIN